VSYVIGEPTPQKGIQDIDRENGRVKSIKNIELRAEY
jgi:hypothetical protein